MNIKKCICISMAMCIVFGMTACQREVPADAPKATKEVEADKELVPEKGAKLYVMTSAAKFAKAVGEKFTKKYGVEVRVEDKGIGLIDKLKLDGANGADVIICAHDEFQDAMNAKLFSKLLPQVEKDVRATVNEVGVDSVTSDGGLYGVPVSLETSCLFYNKDIVGDKPATTFEEIFEKSDKYTDVDKNKYSFLTNIGDTYKLYPFLSVYGYRAFGASGTDLVNNGFDTDEFEKGLEIVGKLKTIMKADSTNLRNDSYIREMFAQGFVAYEISGPWDIEAFDKKKLNYGVTTLPTYDGKEMKAYAGVQNAHVSAYSKYPIAAQLFAEELVSEESAGLLYSLEKKITTRKDISKVKGLSEDEKTSCFVKQFSNSVTMPSIPEVKSYWTLSGTVAQLVFDGERTPAEGRSKMVTDFKKLTQK